MTSTIENYVEPTPLTFDQMKEAADGCWYGVPVGSSEDGDVWAFTHDRRRAAAAVSAWARYGSLYRPEIREYAEAFLSPDATAERWGRVIDTCGHIEPDKGCDEGLFPCDAEFGWVIRRGDTEATPGALPYLELRS